MKDAIAIYDFLFPSGFVDKVSEPCKIDDEGNVFVYSYVQATWIPAVGTLKPDAIRTKELTCP